MSQAGIISVNAATPGVLDQLTGNSGTAVADASHNINIVTDNTTVKFVGAVSTITQDFGGTNLLLGDNGAAIAGAVQSVGVGQLALSSLTSGHLNTALGNSAGRFITTGGQNTLVGADSGTSLITGSNNTILGENAFTLSDGSNNIIIGSGAGTSAGSSNIIIGVDGVGGESNTIRIGDQGVTTGKQSRIFLAGVLNTSSGRVRNITTPAAYPYTTLITDDVIMVDTSSARTITPMAAPVNGTTYTIKDSLGTAAAFNVTITPSGHNIDGAASYILNNNYESVEIIYSSATTEWKVI